MMDEIKYVISSFIANEDGSVNLTSLIINNPKFTFYRFGFRNLKFSMGDDEASIGVNYDAYIDYAGEAEVLTPEFQEELERVSKLLIEQIVTDFIADFNKHLDEPEVQAETFRIT
jgi:capsule polysaccharide export protein KpsC/LpsZ